jgi:hypothetical protein
LCLKKRKRVSVERGWLDSGVGELKKKWCEGGKGEKIERRTRIVIDCVPSPETAAGVQATERRQGREKDKGIMPPNIWEIQLKTYNTNLPCVSYETFYA